MNKFNNENSSDIMSFDRANQASTVRKT